MSAAELLTLTILLAVLGVFLWKMSGPSLSDRTLTRMSASEQTSQCQSLDHLINLHSPEVSDSSSKNSSETYMRLFQLMVTSPNGSTKVCSLLTPSQLLAQVNEDLMTSSVMTISPERWFVGQELREQYIASLEPSPVDTSTSSETTPTPPSLKSPLQ